MAFNIPNYLMSLSDNDGEKLEEIISNYYEEFLSTYWIIKKYNTEVDTSKYKKTDTSLSLSYTFNKGFKVKPILKEIESTYKEDPEERYDIMKYVSGAEAEDTTAASIIALVILVLVVGGIGTGIYFTRKKVN